MEKIETWQIGSERPPPHVGKVTDEEIKPKREQPKLEFQQQEKHIESTQTTPESGDGKGNIPESPGSAYFNFRLGRQPGKSGDSLDAENFANSILINLISNIETDEVLYQAEQKTMEHPLGLSEVDKTAGEGGAGHGSSKNNIESQNEEYSDRNQELTQDTTESKDNSCREDINFAKPKKLRRRSRVIRAPEPAPKQKIRESLQSSSETEEEGRQGFNKRKRSSPEPEEKEKRRLPNRWKMKRSNKMPRLRGNTEQKTGRSLISEVDKLNLQKAILRQETGEVLSNNELNETVRTKASLEQVEMEKTIIEKEQIRKKHDPCDCGGSSSHHMMFYEINDGPLTRHLCIGSKAKTELKVGLELYTKKERNDYVKQMKEFESSYANRSETDMEMETTEIEKDKEKAGEVNKEQRTVNKDMIEEKSKTIYTDMVQFNLQQEEKKKEREAKKELARQRRKLRRKSETDGGKTDEGSKNRKESVAVKFMKEKIPTEDLQEAGPSRPRMDKSANLQVEEIPRRTVKENKTYHTATERQATYLRTQEERLLLEKDIKREAQKRTTAGQKWIDMQLEQDTLTEKYKTELNHQLVKMHIIAGEELPEASMHTKDVEPAKNKPEKNMKEKTSQNEMVKLTKLDKRNSMYERPGISTSNRYGVLSNEELEELDVQESTTETEAEFQITKSQKKARKKRSRNNTEKEKGDSNDKTKKPGENGEEKKPPHPTGVNCKETWIKVSESRMPRKNRCHLLLYKVLSP
ncbi:hypothetical protein JTB14_029011 [Gonioctena quinquepunctata]|nr:hypothetical protein JTB14_029011 [Gonioctena quinquepunctata]